MKIKVHKKTSLDADKMRSAAKLSTQILKQIYDATRIGVSPSELNTLAGELCAQNGVKPAFKDVLNPRGEVFGGNICISVNEAVLHGTPFSKAPLADGDVVKLDFGIILDGHYTDQCVTLGLGNISEADKALIATGKMAVQAGLKQVQPGRHTGDAGHAIQTIAEMAGFNVLKEYIGHGIGKSLWEEPEIPAYGNPGMGQEFEPGMVVCIEAQVVSGDGETFVDEDDWTVVTVDGSKGVMFEYMVLVTETGSEVLTSNLDWEIFSP
ncbi:MAG: type I methionyl aminopeptidase [Candidatus Doudnabacteria bacterium]|nr:type I methionyl aminopeptidase [Candidatus Doudnabacteria bacterium]